jgi:hypothetical protein
MIKESKWTLDFPDDYLLHAPRAGARRHAECS